MAILHFPLWVRILSRFQEDGNDGLTRSQRRHLARRYARTGGRKPSRRERRRIRALLDWDWNA